MISVALDFRAWISEGSVRLNTEKMRKERKQKGVTERILHFKAPKMRYSILSTVCVSNTIPPSTYTYIHGYVYVHTLYHVKLGRVNCVVPENQKERTG